MQKGDRVAGVSYAVGRVTGLWYTVLFSYTDSIPTRVELQRYQMRSIKNCVVQEEFLRMKKSTTSMMVETICARRRAVNSL